MVQIKILPPQIVNRIAAGEVIERPASVVKELVENSIDAGASEVLVEVEEGGRQLIRVRDNGGGMSPEDLTLAFRSHATSKLSLPSGGEEGQGLELFDLATLGFRGEALASIAAVAEVEVISRQPDAECGYRYRIRGTLSLDEDAGGEGPEPVAAPAGTSIEVRNLFFNTPARRKFLRTNATEMSHVVEQVVRIALGFPGIRLSLTSGKRRLLDCPATSSFRDRLASVIGRERAGELIEVREPPGGHSGVKVRGFIGPPHLHRTDSRGQQFFVDGRWVRDRVLGHAVLEAYQGYQISGRKPLAYLFVNLPRGAVDVNVHPTKSEVRFLDSSSVHRATYHAVRSGLERGEGMKGDAPEGATGEAAAGGSGTAGPAAGPRGSRQAEEMRDRVRAATTDFFATGSREKSRAAVPSSASSRTSFPSGRRSPVGPARELSGEGPSPPGDRRSFQVLQSYIVVESGEGIIFYDQHALHEKVLYERILARLREGEMPRQKLIIPEVVELPLELVPLMEEVKARLEPLGFEVEPFGPRELAVRATPAILDQTPPGPLVIEVARWLHGGGAGGAGSAEDSSRGANPLGAEVRRLAQLVACKHAVKAGMPLGNEEIHALLASASSALDPRFCPHGRPTSVEISRAELDRRFQRK